MWPPKVVSAVAQAPPSALPRDDAELWLAHVTTIPINLALAAVCWAALNVALWASPAMSRACAILRPGKDRLCFYNNVTATNHAILTILAAVYFFAQLPGSDFALAIGRDFHFSRYFATVVSA